jgi:serine phosphatase RsbU (regulator of sigma subunit)
MAMPLTLHLEAATLGDLGEMRRFVQDGDAMMLGAFPDFEAAETTVRLEPGDLLVAFTDGVTDAWNKERTRFGDRRFADALGAVADRGADGAVEGVLAAIDDFSAGMEAAYDITLLAVGRLRASAGG